MSDWPGWVRRSAYVAVVVVLALVATHGRRRGGGAPSAPAGRRHHAARRARRQGRGAARRARHPAGVRRHRARTSSARRASSRRRTGSSRWTSAATSTAGRLSELFGESTVETDMYIRTMGWRRVAAREYDLLDPSTRAYLNAYSDGVNAYLKGRSATELSVEYTVLGLTGLDYEPEEWTPVDSLAWLKAMAWDLRGNMDEEIARTRLSRRPHAGAGRRALPALPLRAARADRRPDRRQRAPTHRPAPALGTGGAAGARRGAPRRRGDPRADGPRRRHRLQQLGGLRRAHGLGQAAAGQRPAPETPRSPASGTRWGCTARRSTTTAPSTSAGSPSPACPAW